MAIKALCHKIVQSSTFAYAIVAASGLLTPLAFAPYRMYWLMPLLLGVLLWYAVSRKMPIRLAYLWGFCAYGSQFYWVYNALHNIAGLPTLYALPLSSLFPAYLALYPALCFWLLGHLHLPKNKKLVLAFPLLWVVCEFIRERALTGFGWGALGYSQVADSPLAGFAPVGGLYLVTFLTALITALCIFVLRTRNFRYSVCAVMLSILIVSIGLHLKTVSFTTPTGQQSSVALVQGNVPQTLKWQESEALPTIEKYYRLVNSSKADITILPETALPFFQQDIPDIVGQFAQAAQDNKSALVLGISRYNEDGNFLNAAVNLSGYKAEEPFNQPFYAKDHLVPFGEYIPLPALTGWLYTKMDIPLLGGASGGEKQRPLALANQKVAFNICYEDAFGDELIYNASQSTLLANISNMAWYGDSHAMDIHLQLSQMRASELGRYMVRATNTGMTAVINPKGEIETLAAPNTEQVLTWTIEGHQGQTPFMAMGGSLYLILSAGFLLLLLYGYGFWKFKKRLRKLANTKKTLTENIITDIDESKNSSIATQFKRAHKFERVRKFERAHKFERMHRFKHR